MSYNSNDKTLMALILFYGLWCVGSIAGSIFLVYVVWHFVSKFW